MNILESIADTINNVLSPLMPLIEKWWLYLLIFPLLVVVAIITKYFGLW